MKINKSLSELKARYNPVLRKCEVCESLNFIPFQQYSRVGSALEYGRNQTLICAKCSYKMQNPRYPNEFYKEYYSEDYRKICFGCLAPDQSYIDEQKERGARVLNYCEKFFNKPAVVLDHGSASGGALIPFQEKGWSVYGVDPHEASVLSGKKELGLDIRLGFGEKLPFENKSIDLVISLGSLEHAYDIGKTLKEIKRVLQSDSGYLFIRWRSDKLWGSPLEFFNHNHYRFFTDKTLKLLLLLHGFEVIEVSKIEIEQKPGEVYTIAKAKSGDVREEFNSLLKKYEEENLSFNEINRHSFYKLDYLIRAKEFIQIWENSNKNYQEFASEIRANKKQKHRILLGEEKFSIDRALNEAKSYISEWEKGNVF